jgi:hypothetical protein
MTHLDICSTSYGKKKVESKTNNLTLDHKKSGIDLTPMCAGEMRHNAGKFLMKAITLL